MVSVCIYLTANDIDYLSPAYFSAYIFFLVKYLFILFFFPLHFYLVVYFFCYGVESAVYICWYESFIRYILIAYFCQCIICLFIFVKTAFEGQRSLILMRPYLKMLYSFLFWYPMFTHSFPNPRWQGFSYILSLKIIFQLLDLILWSILS